MMEGLELGVVPSVLDIVVDCDHVIGMVLAERDGGRVIVVGER